MCLKQLKTKKQNQNVNEANFTNEIQSTVLIKPQWINRNYYYIPFFTQLP